MNFQLGTSVSEYFYVFPLCKNSLVSKIDKSFPYKYFGMSFKTVYSCNVKQYQNKTFLTLSNKSIIMWQCSIYWEKRPHHPSLPTFDLIKNHRINKLQTLHIFNFSASIILWYFNFFSKFEIILLIIVDAHSQSLFGNSIFWISVSGSVGLLSPFSCSSMESKLLGAVSSGEMLKVILTESRAQYW